METISQNTIRDHNDANVTVDASASPYEFLHYGVNLIGFDHGHSIRQAVRPAALMANECRQAWSQTVYREWHLGDQQVFKTLRAQAEQLCCLFTCQESCIFDCRWFLLPCHPSFLLAGQ